MLNYVRISLLFFFTLPKGYAPQNNFITELKTSRYRLEVYSSHYMSELLL